MGNLKFEVLSANKKSDNWSDLDKELYEICLNKKEEEFNQVIRTINQPEITMALSKIRRNCVEWINISSNDTVLIIGAGYGELTGMLSEKAKSVICLEHSYVRGRINAARNNDKENVTVYVSTVEKVVEKLEIIKFDYIFLIGSLNEAEEFFEVVENPYMDLLKFAKAHLKENGIMILAEDNKYGVKYFDGTRPNGIDDYFCSFTGGSTKSHMFSKKEIVKMLDEQSFMYEFYYPYPDYKFAMSIFSDLFIPEVGQLGAYDNTWERGKMDLFNQGDALEQMSRDGVFDIFTNSYLILSCQKQILEEEKFPIYIKYSNERSQSLNICTEIYSNDNCQKKVLKRPLTKYSNKHLSRLPLYYEVMSNRYRESKGLYFQKCEKEKRGILSTYVFGQSCMDLMAEWAKLGDKKIIIDTFKRLYEYLKVGAESFFINSKEFQDVFGNIDLPKELKCSASYNNIDLILSNIIVDRDDNWNVIDYEWVFDFPIPIKYILFRSIFYYFKQLGEEWDSFGEEMYAYFNIDKELYDKFIKMEKSFQAYILSGSMPVRHLKQRENIKLFQTPSELFWRTNESVWSVERSKRLMNVLGPNHNLELDIELERMWSSIRIDPISQKCVMKINKIIDGEDNEVVYRTNGKKLTSRCYFFDTKDPQIIINNLNESMKCIHLELELYEMNHEY